MDKRYLKKILVSISAHYFLVDCESFDKLHRVLLEYIFCVSRKKLMKVLYDK